MPNAAQLKEQLHTDGFFVINNAIPSDLLQHLQNTADKFRKIARRIYGVQTQRLQPLERYCESEDQKVLNQFASLPLLEETIASVLGPMHEISMKHLGLMFEPKYLPYCMPWHRDWRDNSKGLDIGAWYDVYRDFDFFNQINCPLLEDHSLWIVRGSHTRPDTPEEQALFPTRPIMAPYNDTERKVNRFSDFLNFFKQNQTNVRSQKCLDYCKNMPQAEQVILKPGDCIIYRNTLWHLGNYHPGQKRATLHTAILTERYQQWIYDQKDKTQAKLKQGALHWPPPHLPTTKMVDGF